MPATDITAAASRLCTACGMCCNGVLFHIVRLQAVDSVKRLETLGLKINRKKREPYFNQPCRALNGCTCTIYADRPTRCRLFECQQIQGLTREEVTEAEALDVILQARDLVAAVERLLKERGNDEVSQPLGERYRQVVEESGEDVALLQEQMQALNDLLNRHFRQEPVALTV
ncbi:MAG: YkgJ family cysteine cluster protein [Prosthecobacter sp.]|nr:YkgJ family cysteine cluster protein [Prosthecobacter sp.]